MPLTDYLDLVSSCSYQVMNHIRQQGVGNILIMLYLGAMVFLLQENPCLSYFKEHGFVVLVRKSYSHSLSYYTKDCRINKNSTIGIYYIVFGQNRLWMITQSS
jgi:hypothetical protein